MPQAGVVLCHEGQPGPLAAKRLLTGASHPTCKCCSNMRCDREWCSSCSCSSGGVGSGSTHQHQQWQQPLLPVLCSCCSLQCHSNEDPCLHRLWPHTGLQDHDRIPRDQQLLLPAMLSAGSAGV